MFSERTMKKELGETDVLKLRMSEMSVAEDALRNSDVIATKESLIASSASGFIAVRASDRFARGGIENFGTDVTGHIGRNGL